MVTMMRGVNDGSLGFIGYGNYVGGSFNRRVQVWVVGRAMGGSDGTTITVRVCRWPLRLLRNRKLRKRKRRLRIRALGGGEGGGSSTKP